MISGLISVGRGWVRGRRWLSYKGFRYPVEIISHCVWLYYGADRDTVSNPSAPDQIQPHRSVGDAGVRSSTAPPPRSPYLLQVERDAQQCVELLEDSRGGHAVGLGEVAAVDPGQAALDVEPALLAGDENRDGQ